MSYYGSHIKPKSQHFTVDATAEDVTNVKPSLTSTEQKLSKQIETALNRESVDKETRNAINFTILGAILGFFIGLSIGRAKLLIGGLGAVGGFMFSKWYTKNYSSTK